MLAGVDAAPSYQAMTVAGEPPIVGSLDAIGPGWSVNIGGHVVSNGELIELAQVGQNRPMFPWDRPHILLVNGDRWPGYIAGIKDDQVRFIPSFGKTQELLLPMSAMVMAWQSSPRSGESPNATNFDLISVKRNTDEVTLTNNDTIRGTILSMDRSVMKIDNGGKASSIPFERIRNIAFNSELARRPKSKGTWAHLVLTSGARLTITEAVTQDGRIIAKSQVGPEVRLLLGELIRLEIRSDQVIALGDLKPTNYEHTPYLGIRWPFTINRSTFENRPLKLGGDVFDFGIGMHSQSRLKYSIPVGAKRWEAWAGLDSDAGRLGNVRVQVLVDGRPVSGPIDFDGTTPPKRIVVNLPADAKELSLDVEFGAGGDTQDNFVWGDARFVRSLPVEPGKP